MSQETARNLAPVATFEVRGDFSRPIFLGLASLEGLTDAGWQTIPIPDAGRPLATLRSTQATSFTYKVPPGYKSYRLGMEYSPPTGLARDWVASIVARVRGQCGPPVRRVTTEEFGRADHGKSE